MLQNTNFQIVFNTPSDFMEGNEQDDRWNNCFFFFHKTALSLHYPTASYFFCATLPCL